MPGHVAAHVDGHRETGDMGGIGLDGDPAGGGNAAEALRPDAQPIDRLPRVLLPAGVAGIAARLI